MYFPNCPDVVIREVKVAPEARAEAVSLGDLRHRARRKPQFLGGFVQGVDGA